MSPHSLASFRRRLAQRGDSALGSELAAALLARRDIRGGHADWGLLCEQAGLFGLAFHEFQLALRDDPEDMP